MVRIKDDDMRDQPRRCPVGATTGHCGWTPSCTPACMLRLAASAGAKYAPTSVKTKNPTGASSLFVLMPSIVPFSSELSIRPPNFPAPAAIRPHPDKCQTAQHNLRPNLIINMRTMKHIRGTKQARKSGSIPLAGPR